MTILTFILCLNYPGWLSVQLKPCFFIFGPHTDLIHKRIKQNLSKIHMKHSLIHFDEKCTLTSQSQLTVPYSGISSFQ